MKSSPRIALLHYHIHPGGVTRVMQHAIRALEGEYDFTVITGQNDSLDAMRGLQCSILELPGLGAMGYARVSSEEKKSDSLSDIHGAPLDSADALAGKILQSADSSRSYDVYHIHNHSLGKNPVFTEMVYQLAAKGRRLLLQIHDFAEDGRPHNYHFLRRYLESNHPGAHRKILYPQSPHVHYAVLNKRDRRLLEQAGVSPDRLHDLPNPVWLEDGGKKKKIESLKYDRLFVYPTRAIRRKNLGEFLFWAAAAEPGDLFAVTLAPQNPAARSIYERWVHLAKRLNLPVEWEIGERRHLPFSSLMRSADAHITTSVAEGFGLAFLEPWLFDRPLLGRNFPEITQDFSNEGVDLSHLYSALWIPVDWFKEDLLRQKIERAARRYFLNYHRPFPPDFTDQVMQSMIHGGCIDFGRLDEELQEQAITMITQSSGARREVNPPDLPVHVNGSIIEKNRRIIQNKYSLEQYGKRLSAIYQTVASSPTGIVEAIDIDRLLDGFLAPERLSLLRTS